MFLVADHLVVIVLVMVVKMCFLAPISFGDDSVGNGCKNLFLGAGS